MSVSRRDFLGAGAAAAAGIAAPDIVPGDAASSPSETAPPLLARAFAGRPVVISSANGNRQQGAPTAGPGSRSPTT